MRIFVKFFEKILALSVVFLFYGCSSVTITQPLSTQPKPIDKDKFEGTWLIEKDTAVVRFASNGVARIAGVEWKGENFRLVQGEMIVTEGKTENFISIRFAEDGVWTNRYLFAQYTFTDTGDLVLWPPNTSEFEDAIRTKTLQGVVTKGQYSSSINVTNSPTDMLDFMNDPQRVNLFNYREPMVLRRIIAPEKAEPKPEGDGKPAPSAHRAR